MIGSEFARFRCDFTHSHYGTLAYSGINANVHTEPPVGTLPAA